MNASFNGKSLLCSTTDDVVDSEVAIVELWSANSKRRILRNRLTGQSLLTSHCSVNYLSFVRLFDGT